MSPVLVNGRMLGVAENGVFTRRNTDPIPGGRLWPEAALTWNAARAEAIRDGVPAREFMPAGSRSSARERRDQDFFWTHQPPPAAWPYTSNHGWAIAVDVLGPRAQAWLLTNGHRYGWSHDEGARVGEAWHYRYVGVSKRRLRKIRNELDPLRLLTAPEEAWAREYDRLKAKGIHRPRRVELRALMKRRRKAIWAVAQTDGWDKRHRLERYRLLKARSS